MIDLYALTSPNVRKIYIMLEEIGLPYKEIFVDVWKGDNYAPNSARSIRTVRFRSSSTTKARAVKPFTVIESGAILMYLADKTGRFLPKETGSRYEVIQWLMIQVASVGPMFGQFTHFKMFAPAGNDYSMSRYQTEVRAALRGARRAARQERLSWRRRILDRRHRDVPVDGNHNVQGVRFEDIPNLERWTNAIAARPAVQRAIKKVEAIKSSRETATADDKDRFFGRGRYARA